MILGWFGNMKNLLEMFVGRETQLTLTPTYQLLKVALDTDAITNGVDGFLTMNGIGEVYYKVINGMYEKLLPLGMALLTTYFLLNLITTGSKESITVESFIKSLISLVSVVAILNNMPMLINKVLSLGDSFVATTKSLAQTSTYSNEDVALAMCDNVFGPYVFNKILALITSNHGFQFFLFAVCMWVMHWVVMIGVYIAAASRLLDIGWRMAAMPIGIVDVFEGGAHSNGIRYFKSFVASVLSGGLMLLIVNVGMATSESIIVSSLEADIGSTPSTAKAWGRYVTETINDLDDVKNKVISMLDNEKEISDDEQERAEYGFRIMAMAAAVQLATVGAAIGAPANAKELMS